MLLPERDTQVCLVSKRQRRVLNSFQIDDRVLEGGNRVVHRSRRRRGKKTLTHERGEVGAQEQRNFDRHVRVRQLRLDLLARESPPAR